MYNTVNIRDFPQIISPPPPKKKPSELPRWSRMQVSADRPLLHGTLANNLMVISLIPSHYLFIPLFIHSVS